MSSIPTVPPPFPHASFSPHRALASRRPAQLNPTGSAAIPSPPPTPLQNKPNKPIKSACRIGSGTRAVVQLASVRRTHVSRERRCPLLTNTAFVLPGSGEALRACAIRGRGGKIVRGPSSRMDDTSRDVRRQCTPGGRRWSRRVRTSSPGRGGGGGKLCAFPSERRGSWSGREEGERVEGERSRSRLFASGQEDGTPSLCFTFPGNFLVGKVLWTSKEWEERGTDRLLGSGVRSQGRRRRRNRLDEGAGDRSRRQIELAASLCTYAGFKVGYQPFSGP